MVESAKFADATVEKIEANHVIMAVGVGDRNVCNILFGRRPFVKAAATQETAKEIKILRVDVANEDELNDLKLRVVEAKSELDPGVEPGVQRPADRHDSTDADDDAEDSQADAAEEKPAPKAKSKSRSRSGRKSKPRGSAGDNASAGEDAATHEDDDDGDGQ